MSRPLGTVAAETESPLAVFFGWFLNLLLITLVLFVSWGFYAYGQRLEHDIQSLQEETQAAESQLREIDVAAHAIRKEQERSRELTRKLTLYRQELKRRKR